MKPMTVINIEKAIKEFQVINKLDLDFSAFDLARYIWEYIKD